MSDFRAIGGVSATLQALLGDRMEWPDGIASAPITIGPPPFSALDVNPRLEPARVNLFLYRVTEHGFLQNQEIPARGTGSGFGHPPLSLNLHYLVTAYGNEEVAGQTTVFDDSNAQFLLGSAMRVLHDLPVVTPNLATVRPPSGVIMLHASLRDDFEQLKTTLEPLTLDDLSKIWTALGLRMRLGASYVVNVVQIESRRRRTFPRPVGQPASATIPPLPTDAPAPGRMIYVFPIQTPTITDVRVRRLGDTVEQSIAYARIGDTLVLRGTSIFAPITTVAFGDVEVPASFAGPDRVEAALPDATIPGLGAIPPERQLQPGVRTARIILRDPMVPGARFSSNEAPFMLVPAVNLATLAYAGGPPRTLTIQGTRLIGTSPGGETVIGRASIPRASYLTATPTQITVPIPELVAGARCAPAARRAVAGSDSARPQRADAGDHDRRRATDRHGQSARYHPAVFGGRDPRWSHPRRATSPLTFHRNARRSLARPALSGAGRSGEHRHHHVPAGPHLRSRSWADRTTAAGCGDCAGFGIAGLAASDNGSGAPGGADHRRAAIHHCSGRAGKLARRFGRCAAGHDHRHRRSGRISQRPGRGDGRPAPGDPGRGRRGDLRRHTSGQHYGRPTAITRALRRSRACQQRGKHRPGQLGAAAMNLTRHTISWRDGNVEWLRLALRHLRLRLHRYALRSGAGAPQAVDWLVAGGEGAPPRASTSELDREISDLSRAMAACESRMRDAGRAPALRTVAELAGLDQLECAVLLLVAAPALDGAFTVAYAQLQGDWGRGRATLQLALAMEVEDVDARLMAIDLLMPERRLRALRLIDAEADTREPLLTRGLSVDERMADYLRGVNRIDARVERMLARLPAAPASDSATRAGLDAAALIAAQSARWATVNFIGRIGRGAEQAAQVACDDLHLTPLLLDVSRLAALSSADRSELLALLGREALLAGVALIIDTRNIQNPSEQASVVDELIANVAATLFIVSAERWPTDRGVATVRVTSPSRDEQRQLWRAAMNGGAQQIESEIDAIVQQFDLGGPAISDIVERASHAGSPISAASLWSACREQSGMVLDELACRLSPCYGWDDIVLPDDVRAQLRELAGQVRQRGRVYDRWGFGAQLARGRGITALFAGASGTGKTMAAEILAADLALDLYRIDLAGVVSKYIGETEKNLRRVFEAAERSGAILFFDEADTLFGTRTEVRDSHDRYANLEVNYLLQRMEDYAGLAILATNRRSSLDSAFLRRLRFVIEFPFPSADDRRRIWERAFPTAAPTERLELGFLSRLDLSGGNIKSIALNAAFLAATAQVPIGMPTVMQAAAREYAKLSKSISAAEFGPYYKTVQP